MACDVDDLVFEHNHVLLLYYCNTFTKRTFWLIITRFDIAPPKFLCEPVDSTIFLLSERADSSRIENLLLQIVAIPTIDTN
jgi:hypothetical protein